MLDGATLAAKFSPRLFSRSRPQLSPDGQTIAFADDWGVMPSASIVDALSGRTLVSGDGLDGEIRALAFAPMVACWQERTRAAAFGTRPPEAGDDGSRPRIL